MSSARELRTSRGFTLVEVMVVVIIAAVVGFGLVGFYLNSQATWLDASTQALAQRDATLIVETITNRGRLRSTAGLSIDSTTIYFYDEHGLERDRFFLDAADHRVYRIEERTVPRGPVTDTYVERLCMRLDASLPNLVRIDTLRVHSATGEKVQLASVFALYNRP